MCECVCMYVCVSVCVTLQCNIVYTVRAFTEKYLVVFVFAHEFKNDKQLCATKRQACNICSTFLNACRVWRSHVYGLTHLKTNKSMNPHAGLHAQRHRNTCLMKIRVHSRVCHLFTCRFSTQQSLPPERRPSGEPRQYLLWAAKVLTRH